MKENFAVVRTFNVEKLNEVLKREGTIICQDSKLDRTVEIRFITESERIDERSNTKKIKLIQDILNM